MQILLFRQCIKTLCMNDNNDYYVQKINKRYGKYYAINVPSKLISKLQLDNSSDSPNYCKIYFDPQNEQLVFKRLNLEESE